MAGLTVTVSGSPATITGLSAGSWSFTVSAVAASGRGPASAASAPVAVTAAGGGAVLTVDRGAWSNSSTYAWDDVVTTGGQTWYCVCQTGVLGIAPGTDPTRWGTAVA